MSIAGQMRLSTSLRSSTISWLPVPLNSSKITSSMRLPVSTRAVPMIVSEPPSSTLRAEPKNRLGRCKALASTPPESILPELGHSEFQARASRVIESRKISTSWPYSTIRLAFSSTISETWMCRAAGSSKVELMTSQFGPFTSPLHVGDFLGPLVDQEHEDVQVGIVRQGRLGHLLHEDRLAGPRRADDQTPLPEADGHDQVDHPHLDLVGGGLHADPLVGVQRGQVVEGDLAGQQVGVLVVDRLDAEQGEVALVLLGRADLPGDRRPGLQAEAANLAGRDVDVVGAGEVVVVGTAEEAEAVGQDLQRPLAVHQPVELHPLLEDLEDQVVLLDAGDTR